MIYNTFSEFPPGPSYPGNTTWRTCFDWRLYAPVVTISPKKIGLGTF